MQVPSRKNTHTDTDPHTHILTQKRKNKNRNTPFPKNLNCMVMISSEKNLKELPNRELPIMNTVVLTHIIEAMSVPNKKGNKDLDERRKSSKHESRIHKENPNKNISGNPQQNRLCRKQNITTGR